MGREVEAVEGFLANMNKREGWGVVQTAPHHKKEIKIG